MPLNPNELTIKMDNKEYSEVFSEINKYITDNPSDKDAKKLYNKLLNDYKKREQKAIYDNTLKKIDQKLFDEALGLIEVYMEIVSDDKKAVQLKEKINQEKTKYEIETGYAAAKEQFDSQNYTEAIKILIPLIKQYKTESKLLKLKDLAESEKWQAQLTKWDSEARESLQNEQFDNALKKVEMLLKRDSSNKSALKLREKILEEEKKTGKKKLWDEINTQIKIQNFSIALTRIKELLKIDPTDSKAQKLQSDIIEKEMKFEKKKILDLAQAELKAFKFSDALNTLDSVADKFESDKDFMGFKEKIQAEELKFKIDNLIETAKNFIKNKNYEGAEQKLDEAIDTSNNMSKEAITLKADLQKKSKKDKVDKLFEICAVYQKGKNFEEALQVINQILEIDPENGKALKIKSSFDKELATLIPEVSERPPVEEEGEAAGTGEVQVVREYDYVGGEIRFKVAIRNLTKTAITNITVLLNVTEQYTIESLTKQVPYLAPGESRGVDFMLMPMACGQSKVFGTISYSDAFGEPQSVTIKPKTISIKCPLVVPESSTRAEIDDWLKSQLKSSCSVPLGNLPKNQGFKFANEQIAALDLRNVLMDDKKLIGEFLGIAKVTNNKILVRATALEDSVQIDVFTDDMKSATGILAYIRNLVLISMNVQSDLQLKEDKIGTQILDAFEIIGRLTKVCDLCQIRGAVKDGLLILNELIAQVQKSYLKEDLLTPLSQWHDNLKKQKDEKLTESIANELAFNAIEWVKIAHQITQSKYGVYKDTFDSSASITAMNQIRDRISSIEDEIHALEIAYMRTILKYLMIIFNENGLVVYKQGFGKMDFDSDLVGGFLTAIQSFGLEISQKDTPVTKLAYKDFELELTDGNYVRVAIVLAGKATNLIKEKLSSFKTDFEIKFKPNLSQWDGNIEPFQTVKPDIIKAFSLSETE